jgi:hypothetical protein
MKFICGQHRGWEIHSITSCINLQELPSRRYSFCVARRFQNSIQLLLHRANSLSARTANAND